MSGSTPKGSISSARKDGLPLSVRVYGKLKAVKHLLLLFTTARVELTACLIPQPCFQGLDLYIQLFGCLMPSGIIDPDPLVVGLGQDGQQFTFHFPDIIQLLLGYFRDQLVVQVIGDPGIDLGIPFHQLKGHLPQPLLRLAPQLMFLTERLDFILVLVDPEERTGTGIQGITHPVLRQQANQPHRVCNFLRSEPLVGKPAQVVQDVMADKRAIIFF
jgi:hypothetical protein